MGRVGDGSREQDVALREGQRPAGREMSEQIFRDMVTHWLHTLDTWTGLGQAIKTSNSITRKRRPASQRAPRAHSEPPSGPL